jgi:hypothetical protein
MHPVTGAEPAQDREGRGARQEGEGHQGYVVGVGETQSLERVRCEERDRDLQGELHEDQEEQEAPGVPARGAPHDLQGRERREGLRARRGLALARQAGGGAQAARGGQQEEGGEDGQRLSLAIAQLKEKATRQEPCQHPSLREAVAPREVARTDAPRNEGAHPGVPCRAGGQAGPPVQRRDPHDRGDGAPAQQGGRREGEKTKRLSEGARHHPPAMRAQAPHRPGGGELEDRPGHEGDRHHQPGQHLAQSQRQHEGRKVRLPDAQHDAVEDAVGGDGAQVAPKGGGGSHPGQGGCPVGQVEP